MKRVAGLVAVIISIAFVGSGYSQNNVDDERMGRDIEVAENVLSTLIKQQFEKRRSFFPMNVEGSHASGYGVTFRVPSEGFGPLVWGVDGDLTIATMPGSYSYTTDGQNILTEDVRGRASYESRNQKKRQANSDSIKASYNQKIIDAGKNFIADYGDLISQLGNDEKIVVTNRGEGRRVWVGAYVNGYKQSYLSIEGTKSDINQYKQGKINREQLLSRIKVINSEMDDELQPDLELLSSIFNRLYQRDLSKTYFTEDNIYYERLKGYGVVYYMQVFSSNQEGSYWSMPTIRKSDLTQKERDEKVKELYPVFEKSVKEDILEYGRTLKSLSGEESLVFDVTLTRCKECGIPSSVEYSIKHSVLSDYAAGKISKDNALAKFSVKKGPNQ